MAATKDQPVTVELYRASEFAAKAGVTVRTLHHYDRLGLLKPGGRTGSGYRMYGEAELARLQQIVTLKFIGLPLQQIRELLDRNSSGNALDLAATLRLQRRAIEGRIRDLQSALLAITRAEQVAGGDTDWEALRKIMEVLEMQQNNDWMMEYYSDEAREKIATNQARWTPELQAKSEQDWKHLIAEVEAAITDRIKPESAAGRALGARWSGLIAAFTGGDPHIAAGLKKLYSDEKNWPKTSFWRPYSDEVGRFACAAMEANKKKDTAGK